MFRFRLVLGRLLQITNSSNYLLLENVHRQNRSELVNLQGLVSGREKAKQAALQ